jgi:hypothetical protein
MLNSITREEKNYLENFQQYVISAEISDTDRAILEQLEYFISNDAKTEYSDAIDNYHFNEDKIKKNKQLIAPENIDDFWLNHRSHLFSMLEDSRECPACGLAYNKFFNHKKTIEHVLPKSEYQQYILSPINLYYLCESCNSRKGNRISEGRIFHPLFSNINCCTKPDIELILLTNSSVEIKVSINESNIDYRHFIKKLFKIHLTYKNFIKKLFNIVISSVETTAKYKLVGLTFEEKQIILSKFFKQNLLLDFCLPYIETETEKMILEKLNIAVEQEPLLFSSYILNNSNTLKNY